jgi:hypothetical protein
MKLSPGTLAKDGSGMWKIAEVKREGRRVLRSNYLVCFVACLVYAFIAGGTMSISATVDVNKYIMERVAVEMRGTPVAGALEGLIEGAERFKKSTSLGSDATKGRIGGAYQRLAASNGVHGLIANAINKDIANGKLAPSAVGLMSLLLSVLISLFIGGVVEIGRARIFLESRGSPDTRLIRLFFIYLTGGTRRVALIVFLRALFLILWAFTIVGFPIKYYSYRLVPYIVAENPGIKPKEAFALSIRLMRGHKMRMFLFDLSFIPLLLLSVLTFGLLSYAWLNPYYNSSKAMAYAAIRCGASDEVLSGAKVGTKAGAPGGAPGGMLSGELDLREFGYRRLPAKVRDVLSYVGAKPKYSYINMAFMFLFFSFVGWVFECSLWLIGEGLIVNRGTMYGPWIPIYGVGGIVIIALVNRFYKKPLACFFMIIAVCAPIEYAGAWILWQTRHLKYWDYSDYFLNLQGRICLEGMLNFAILGTLGIYIIAPVLDSLLNRIPIKTRKAICAALFTAFFIDAVCAGIWPRSGKGITNDVS